MQKIITLQLKHRNLNSIKNNKILIIISENTTCIPINIVKKWNMVVFFNILSLILI